MLQNKPHNFNAEALKAHRQHHRNNGGFQFSYASVLYRRASEPVLEMWQADAYLSRGNEQPSGELLSPEEMPHLLSWAPASASPPQLAGFGFSLTFITSSFCCLLFSTRRRSGRGPPGASVQPFHHVRPFQLVADLPVVVPRANTCGKKEKEV